MGLGQSGLPPSTTLRYFVNYVLFSTECVAKTGEACRGAAKEQGLIFGQVGKWANHDAGCYAYKYGKYAGWAYFNTADGDMTTKLTLPKYRLNCPTAGKICTCCTMGT